MKTAYLEDKMFMCCRGSFVWLPRHDGRFGIGSFHMMLNSPLERLGTIALAFMPEYSYTLPDLVIPSQRVISNINFE